MKHSAKRNNFKHIKSGGRKEIIKMKEVRRGKSRNIKKYRKKGKERRKNQRNK